MVRPLKFETVEELKAQIDKYFAHIQLNPIVDKDGVSHYEPLTITGLALALGTSRQTLMNYEDRDEYYDIVKTAKTRIEHYAEKRLYGNNVTGPIFLLKNFGWKDPQDHNHGGQKDNPVEHKDVSSADARLFELISKIATRPKEH